MTLRWKHFQMCAKCLNHVNVWPPCFAAFLNSVVDLSARIASENRRLEMYIDTKFMGVGWCWVSSVEVQLRSCFRFLPIGDWRMQPCPGAGLRLTVKRPSIRMQGPAPPSSGETLRPQLPWNKSTQTPRCFLLRVAVSKTRPGHIAAVFTASWRRPWQPSPPPSAVSAVDTRHSRQELETNERSLKFHNYREGSC